MRSFILSLILVLISTTCRAKVGFAKVLKRSTPVIAYQFSKVNVQTNIINSMHVSRIKKQQIQHSEHQVPKACFTITTSQLLNPNIYLLNQQKTMKEIVREREDVKQKKTECKLFYTH